MKVPEECAANGALVLSIQVPESGSGITRTTIELLA
jgi:hypothetical protein